MKNKHPKNAYLNKAEWQSLEKMYPYICKTYFKPPKAFVGDIITETKYQMKIDEMNLIENSKSEMLFLGVAKIKNSTDFVEYYLSDDDKLYTFLYKEKLEFNYKENEEDDEECDIIHTGDFECVTITINLKI